MIKAPGKFRTADGVVFCFLASVIIAVAALNIGLLTEPGKIIPAALSMRTEEMNGNILQGIDVAAMDIKLIRSGAGFADIWRLLTFVHADLFFYLACLLPEAASRTVLLIGFYIRFGLCCSAMYYFLSEHIRLNRLPAALLAAMYTFSSQIIFTAQCSSVMNMAVMIPVIMSAFNSYLQKRTWKAFIAACACSFGLAFTGGFGIMTGMPVMVLISLLMCISLYKTFMMTITSWFKLLAALLAGLTLDMAFLIPGLTPMNISVDVENSLDNARVTYKVFDLIRGTFLLRSGNISTVGIPVFYIGLFTIAGVIVFALNEQIPLRLKVASAIVVAVIHITCCSSFVNETVSLFGTAPAVNSSRLICLEAVLFFMAGIGLKNAKSLKKGDFIAVALIPMFFLVMSEVSASGTSLASTILVATFIGIICASALVYCLAEEKISKTAKYIVLALVFIMVGINAMFTMFNNTMTGSSTEEYFKGNKNDFSSSALIFDNGFDLPAVSDNEQYLMIPADLSTYESFDQINKINYMAELVSGNYLFEDVFFGIDDIDLMAHLENNEYKLAEGKNTITFSPFMIDEGSRYFVYCSSPNGASVKTVSEFGNSERAFTGPFITEVNTGTSGFTVSITIQAEAEGSCFISLFRLNENVFDTVNSYSGSTGASGFEVDVSKMDGFNTLILPYPYGDDAKISVSCDVYERFEICGKQALLVNTDNIDYIKISVEHQDLGIIPGILVSVFAALCLVAIPFIQRYNEKKKEAGEGNEEDA